MEPFWLVDAFAEAPFEGNCAGVCVLRKGRDASWMQHVANELNQAETAFLRPRRDKQWNLRWFTPTVEVDLCGHATLAAAHVLSVAGHVPWGEEIVFHTLSGKHKAWSEKKGATLDFPAEPPRSYRLPNAETLVHAKPTWIGKNRLDVLIQLESEDAVRRMDPDLPEIAKLDARGLIVTAKSSDPTIDFVSRYFAPACGVDEDQVTGSAHCALAPFWGERLGRTELHGYQASRRGGLVKMRLEGPRVFLRGGVVVVATGKLQT
ncbi:MAG: PhzF family phenazine biosynthesis protein [Fimbriimonadaceae bacterium]|nr:PhzF family phenazine biosynthesis protein [Fimbriimonadaceae bacterium]